MARHRPIELPRKRTTDFLSPPQIADKKARRDSPKAKTNEFYWRIDEVETKLFEFEDNFFKSERLKRLAGEDRGDEREVNAEGEEVIG